MSALTVVLDLVPALVEIVDRAVADRAVSEAELRASALAAVEQLVADVATLRAAVLADDTAAVAEAVAGK